jgi:DNA-binding ferritin-like protein (Dps family)
MNLSDLAAKLVGEKKRWRAYKKRSRQLPGPYRTAIEAIERYMMYAGDGPNDGELAATMLEDLLDLFEQAVAAGTPVRGIVGDDPVDFVEAFVRNYSDGGYVDKERKRLAAGIERAEAEEGER